MLYIQFEIKNNNKYAAFQKLYAHLVAIRQPDFEESPPEFDWDYLSDAETVTALEAIDTFYDEDLRAMQRYQEWIPDEVAAILWQYVGEDEESLGDFWNYLEYGFEVDFDALETSNANRGIICFSTGNYPFGGLDRFLITLGAFELLPNEAFNGFSVIAINWQDPFDFEVTELPDKTARYKNSFSA
ncbi:MAG: hypothetical protein OIF50_09625 [Flavobacteriaceae bacterium]|nr:hypothetical protein [Flavobacteriaceae bacterium]